MPARNKANGSYQGAKWIRREKRLAIYLRDGLACVYCNQAVEDGAELSLDHVVAYSHGGSHAATNLVTCCKKCNSSRGNRPVAEFAAAVASYLDHGLTATMITDHIDETVQRCLDVQSAKQIIAARGWAAAVKSH